MAVQLYGMRMSTCARRCLIVLEETGTAYDFHLVNLMKGEHKQPEHLAKNPFGQIPALVDGDLTLFESRAIIRHIAGKKGDLYPEGKTRSLAEVWINAEQAHWNVVDQIVGTVYFGPMMGKPVDQSKVEELRTKLNEVLPIFEKHLAANKYFAGDSFTLADVCYIPYTQYMLNNCEGFKNAFDAYPHLTAWWKSVSGRPAVAKVFSNRKSWPILVLLLPLRDEDLDEDEAEAEEETEREAVEAEETEVHDPPERTRMARMVPGSQSPSWDV